MKTRSVVRPFHEEKKSKKKGKEKSKGREGKRAIKLIPSQARHAEPRRRAFAVLPNNAAAGGAERAAGGLQACNLAGRQ